LPYSTEATTELTSYFLRAYGGGELQRLAATVDNDLRHAFGSSWSPMQTTTTFVNAINDRELANTRFFAILERDRSNRVREIRGIQALFMTSAPVVAPVVAPTAPANRMDLLMDAEPEVESGLADRMSLLFED